MLKTIEKTFEKYNLQDEETVDVSLKFVFDSIEITFNSGKLDDMDQDNWYKLLDVDGFSLDLSDSYESYCDNGTVKISNCNGKLVFKIDTATGGSIMMKCEIENCRKEISKIPEWIKTI